MSGLTLGALLVAAIAAGFSAGVALGLWTAAAWRRAAERWESAYHLAAGRRTDDGAPHIGPLL